MARVASSEEQFEIFTPDNHRAVGIVNRSFVHKTGLTHRGVHVLICRPVGNADARSAGAGREHAEMLLQRRAMSKDICPGKWDLSCAEHLKPGESFRDAAIRGLAEELQIGFGGGADDSTPASHLLREVHGPVLMERRFDDLDIHDREYDALWVLDAYDEAVHGPIAQDNIEVDGVEWVSVVEVRRRIRENPDAFTPWCVEELQAADIVTFSREEGGGEGGSGRSDQFTPSSERDKTETATARDEHAVLAQLPGQEYIFNLVRGYMQSRCVLAAVELGVFTELSDAALSGSALVRKLGVYYSEDGSSRACWDFLDSLVVLGLLERDGDSGESAIYRNSEDSRLFLDRSKRGTYIGGSAEVAARRGYMLFGRLTEVLRSGGLQNQLSSTGAGTNVQSVVVNDIGEQPRNGGERFTSDATQTSVFDAMLEDEAALSEFLGTMSGENRLNFELLAIRWSGWRNVRSLCDVGGACADLSLSIVRRHPQVKCISMDLSPVQPLAEAAIMRARLSDSVVAVVGDFFAFDPLPAAEVVTMSNILHDWDIEHKRRLIQKAFDALPERGVLICLDMMVDSERRQNIAGMLTGLALSLEFGDGKAGDYTTDEFEAWCRDAGFSRFEFIQLMGPTVAGIAHKM